MREVPWPDEAIHPDEVPELIMDGAYDDWVLHRAYEILGAVMVRREVAGHGGD